MRFLIVDDSSTMRRIIINTLTKLGFERNLRSTPQGTSTDVFETKIFATSNRGRPRRRPQMRGDGVS
jgi:hypothetical protein